MSSQQRNAVASVLFTVLGGPGIALVWAPWLITRFYLPASAPLWRFLVGAALVAAGVVPLLESIARFVVVGRGTLIPTHATERLVVSGLYRFVRNPMYAGVMLAIVGESLAFWNYGLLIELGFFAVSVNLFVRMYEEPRLTRRFGGEYLRYKANVPRWIPRILPWRG